QRNKLFSELQQGTPLREQVKEGTPTPTADHEGGLLRDPHQEACCHRQVTHHPDTTQDLAAGQTDLTNLTKSQPLVRSGAARPGSRGQGKQVQIRGRYGGIFECEP
uniref:Uncharacterized protein n=1 Tax=Mustela putorius furo TaxID=9669 RepID=M3YZP5_MUSPF